jgi:hypothetical protein
MNKPGRPEDDYPNNLEAVRQELDYWAKRQQEGLPGSEWWDRVQARLDHLQRLERRYDTSFLARTRRKLEDNRLIAFVIIAFAVLSALSAVWAFVPKSFWNRPKDASPSATVIPPGVKHSAVYLLYVKSENGQAVTGAKVTLQGIYTVVPEFTDNLGLARFEIPAPLPLKVKVIAEVDGYEHYEQNLDTKFVLGKEFAQEIQLRPVLHSTKTPARNSKSKNNADSVTGSNPVSIGATKAIPKPAAPVETPAPRNSAETASTADKDSSQKDQASAATALPDTKLSDADESMVVKDSATGLMWTRNDNGGDMMPLAGAEPYCKKLRLAGFADWRLPTIDELKPLYNATTGSSHHFIREPFQLNNWFVLSSTLTNAGLAYFDFFNGVGVAPAANNVRNHVFCVRRYK